MRVAAYTAVGTDGVVEPITMPNPTPAAAEVVVSVEACSVNHRDLWNLEGAQGVSESDLPYIGGSDVAGVVEEVGDAIESVDIGDRVVLSPNLTCGVCRFCRDDTENRCVDFGIYDGGFAELCVVDADRLVALPRSVDFTSAAALPISYMTAYHMLRRASVQPGDLVFVPGATGGVGVAAIQLLSVIGASSIATSTSAKKLDRLESLGADHTVLAGTIDEIREAVESIGAPTVALNHLGGEYTALGLETLDRDGTMVICGRTVDRTSTIDIRDLYWEHKRVLGSTMGTQRDLERLVRLVAAGTFEPVVGDTYPLAETDSAFESVDDRSAFGKQIIVPSA